MRSDIDLQQSNTNLREKSETFSFADLKGFFFMWGVKNGKFEDEDEEGYEKMGI